MQMALDEPQANDETYDLNGITAIIDKELLTRAEEVNIDFIEAGFKSGFMINSKQPVVTTAQGNTCGSCSC